MPKTPAPATDTNDTGAQPHDQPAPTPTRSVRTRRRFFEAAWIGALALGFVGVAAAVLQIPSTKDDFFLKGTQPLTLDNILESAQQNCVFCHGNFNEATEPYTRWSASMMGQATRDPVFLACLTISNQDVNFAGEMCLRCHSPIGWIQGRSAIADASGLNGSDLEGVSCSVCHRMVDPVFTAGQSPDVDLDILNALPAQAQGNGVPPNPHSGNYVFDPEDRRRGPFTIPTAYHQWLQSPFHTSSRLCSTCHDISNPLYSKQADGTYALNALDAPPPSNDKYALFPIERTYSEWSRSAFAQAPITLPEFNGGRRFGGNAAAVSSCQDCHMPATDGRACLPFLDAIDRTNLPQHNFNGANSWVLRAVHAENPIDPDTGETPTGLTDDSVNASVNRNKDMLARASDTELSMVGPDLNVRVVNYSGHKLPTGYTEGRRMWVNVKFFNATDQILAERGAYDEPTAVLSAADTKVYESHQGIDAAIATLTGVPAGPTFHFALNNKVYTDNRIPPMGFTNAAFAQVDSQPVAYPYADGQYWDDTRYTPPAGAARAEVRVYHQTTSREYIEFLRDENHTDGRGQTAYDLWARFGRSAPVLMDQASIQLTAGNPCPPDTNHDGEVNANDISAYINLWYVDLVTGTAVADFNHDGETNGNDISDFINAWYAAIVNGGTC